MGAIKILVYTVNYKKRKRKKKKEKEKKTIHQV